MLNETCIIPARILYRHIHGVSDRELHSMNTAIQLFLWMNMFNNNTGVMIDPTIAAWIIGIVAIIAIVTMAIAFWW